MKIINSIILIFLFSTVMQGQNSKRWNLSVSEDSGINWNVKTGEAHNDFIEMSGMQLSAVIHYGVSEKGELQLSKDLIFPMLRLIPNDCFGYLTVNYENNNRLQISVEGIDLQEYPKVFKLKGEVTMTCGTNTPLEVTRTLFPSIDKPILVELVSLKNTGDLPCTVKIKNNIKDIETDPRKGIYGQYIIHAALTVNAEEKEVVQYTLAPHRDYSFAVVYSGKKAYEEVFYAYSPEYELKKREKLVNELSSDLILETPNDTINREFSFAKIRAAESIFDTKGGLMHGPGGAYYAAIWPNDQCEYMNPFFPFLGHINGNESAINCYRHFARYMNDEYRPLPCDIQAEGDGIWDQMDRGDQAMIAYGASRFCLTLGDKKIAEEFWPLIKWCFEYLERKKLSIGVIASESDELEGRFSTGEANLSTNSLAYGGYMSAAYLADELGYADQAALYRSKAKDLRSAMENYFGAIVQGFNTYKYCEGNTKLRSWICLPLVMGITDRKDETVKALLSDYLWTSNGILTESGTTMFWDRATLYAFRGLFANGETDEGMKYFSYYSSMRLLGEHVPYPVEAWPEGGQRHLSGECGLYCRVITEGLFGITPTGFNKFTMTPVLPKNWNYMNLRNIKAFGRTFDLEVIRKGKQEIVTIKMGNGTSIVKRWNMKEPLLIEL
jgi:hypothetical protein